MVAVAAELGLGRLVVVAADLGLGCLVVVAADSGLGRLVVVALDFPRSFPLHLVSPGTLPRFASSSPGPWSPGPTSFLASASGSSRILSCWWLRSWEKLLVSPSLPNVATRVFDVVFTTLIFLFRPFFIPPLLPAARACCLFSSVVRPHRLSGSFRNIMFLICVPPISSRSP